MSAQTPGKVSTQGRVLVNDSMASPRNIPPSPALQRRSSTQTSRPGSSASPGLVRKTSRSSLGASPSHEEKRPTPKRSISNLITELRGAQASMEAIPEPVVMTASEIAAECFTQELARHEEASCDTIVLLHDACYGHRYSRIKTTKGALSMIVERPERLLASVLGVATAYVRLGGHYAGGRNAPRPKQQSFNSPPFKIRRTARQVDIKSTYVTNVHGFNWMTELNELCSVAGKKLAAGEREVARKESTNGIERRMLHEGDLYLCQESLDAFQGALGGVADAVDAVFSHSSTRRAFVAVRPPGHHCSADYPSGFCWLNNVHVGIEYAAQTYDLTHAAIIDFDLHHGDGSQSIAWERNAKNNLKRLYPKSYAKSKMAPDIGYYSIHDINSYPCEMGDDEKVQAASLCIHNAHGQSVWNVHLQTWKTAEEFWKLYETRYIVLLDKARDFLRYQSKQVMVDGKKPKAAIFISAGFDASEWEGEGMQRHKVNVLTDFYARFTEDILEVAREESTNCDGRVISVLEGGYSDRALCSSTLSHLSALCGQKKPVQHGLATSMQLDEQLQSMSLTSGTQYDASWWSATNLSALEVHVNPPPPTATGKKVRAGPHPTYATPTESFAYKVIDPAKFARSVSGTMREGSAPTRPTTPPPPEVDWIIAAHELSKLLIPSDRTTRSNTAEELAGPRIKKEILKTPSPDELGKPRQLRTRGKGMSQTPAQTSKRVVSSGDRRKTMADFSSVAAETELVASRRPSRRSSMASTISTIETVPESNVPPVPPVPVRVTPVAGPIQMKKTRMSLPAADTKQNSSSSPIAPATSVDDVTASIKRITLKVASREESERKAKEKLDADRRARALKGAETRRLNKAAKVAQEKAIASAADTRSLTQSTPLTSVAKSRSADHTIPPTSVANSQSSTHFLPPTSAANYQSPPQPGPSTSAAGYQPLTQSRPSTNTADYQSWTQSGPSTSATVPQIPPQNFPQPGYPVIYQHIEHDRIRDAPYNGIHPDYQNHQSSHQQQLDGTVDDTAISLQQGVYADTSLRSTSHAPRLNTNAQQLPVFSSTGHIPFATPSQSMLYDASSLKALNYTPMPHGTQDTNQPSNVQYTAYPTTQAQLAYTHDYVSTIDNPNKDSDHQQEVVQDPTAYGQAEMQSQHAYDVWAIPDTPAKQNYHPEQ